MENPLETGNLIDVVSRRNDIDLLFAAEHGHLDMVKYSYFLGIDTDRMFEDACIKEYCDIVDFLLEQGVEPESHLITIACENGNGHIFNALIQRVANINHSKFDSSMSEACKRGRKDFVLQLYNYGYNVSKPGFSGLHYACQNRNLEMVQLLLDLGANAKQTTHYGLLPLHLACKDNTRRGYYFQTPIQESPEVVRDRIEIIKLLLPSYIETSNGNTVDKKELCQNLSKLTKTESIKEFLLTFE